MVELGFDSESFQIGGAQRLLEVLGRVGRKQVYCAASEAAAGHPCAERVFDPQRAIHEKIQLWASHFVILLQAAMRFYEQAAHLAQIAVAAGFHEIENALIFSEDVACAPPGYRVMNQRQLAQLRIA